MAEKLMATFFALFIVCGFGAVVARMGKAFVWCGYFWIAAGIFFVGVIVTALVAVWTA